MGRCCWLYLVAMKTNFQTEEEMWQKNNFLTFCYQSFSLYHVILKTEPAAGRITDRFKVFDFGIYEQE